MSLLNVYPMWHGTVTGRIDGHDIDPPLAYRCRPFALNFDGASSTTFHFAVKGLGGELRITAFWWNCTECNVNWIYRSG